MTAVVVLALVVAAAPGLADDCPACLLRGAPRTACFARVATVAGTRGPGCRVCCQDGDPSCDADGAANGACRFLPSACLADDDLALRPCFAHDVARFAVDGEDLDPERHALADGVRALLPARAACAPVAPLTVPLAAGAARAHTVLRTRAWSSATAAPDRDRLTLECSRGPCAPARAAADVLCSAGAPAGGRSRDLEDRILLAAADDRILRLRRRSLALRVVGPHGVPRARVRVAATQLTRSFPFGTAVPRFDGVADDARYLGLVGRLFDTVVTENSLKWAEMEPVEGALDTTDGEAWLAWAGARGLRVKGAALTWGFAQGVPAWLAGRSAADAGEALRRHVQDTVGRFRGRIAVWDVVNEPLSEPYWRNLLGPGWVADVIRTARAADPGATLVLNEAFPYSSRAGLLAQVDRFTQLVRDDVLAAGVAPDAIGFEAHAEQAPLEWTATALDRLAGLGLPIHVTELDAVGTTDSAAQADTYEGLLRLCFGHPAVASITVWGFDDGHHWLGDVGAGMFAASYGPKPAARAFLFLLDDAWRTRAAGRTDDDGTFRFDGFPGRYRVAVPGATREVDLGTAPAAVLEVR